MDEVWIPNPTILFVDGMKYFKWDGLKVKEFPKGVGVFATKILPTDLSIPFGGMHVNFMEYKRLTDLPIFLEIRNFFNELIIKTFAKKTNTRVPCND